MKKSTPQPVMEEQLLLRYVILRGEELLAEEDPTSGRVWRGLALTAAGHSPKQHEQLQELFFQLFPSERDRREMLVKALEVLREVREQLPEDLPTLDADPDGSLSPAFMGDLCFHAHSEGQRMLDENNFQFFSIWRCLVWVILRDASNPAKIEEFSGPADPDLTIDQKRSLVTEITEDLARMMA